MCRSTAGPRRPSARPRPRPESTSRPARALFPRGAVDLALAYHRRGDERWAAAERGEPARPALPRPDRDGVRFRIEAITDKERCAGVGAVFAAAVCRRRREGDLGHGRRDLGDAGRHVRRLQLVHQARDAVGRLRRDRALLAGRQAPGIGDTWEFLDRRIEDVMRIEKVKAEVRQQSACRSSRPGRKWCCNGSSARENARTTCPDAETAGALRMDLAADDAGGRDHRPRRSRGAAPCRGRAPEPGTARS